MQSNKNRTPVIIETEPFSIAKSLVLVRNECSQASIIRTPVASNDAQPIKLRNMSKRLGMRDFIRYPTHKLVKAKLKLFVFYETKLLKSPKNTASKIMMKPQNVPVDKNAVIMSPSLKL